MVDKIPPVAAADAEDVIWALQTAETLWKRGERIDAVVWVRRAAQSAGEADDEMRALFLARQAAELADFLAENTVSSRRTVSDHPRAQAEIDDLLSSTVELEPLYKTPVPPAVHRRSRPQTSDPLGLAAPVEASYADADDADVVTSAPPLAAASSPPGARSSSSSLRVARAAPGPDGKSGPTGASRTEPPTALGTLPPLSMDELEVVSIPPPPPAPAASPARGVPPVPPSHAGARPPPPPLPPSVPRAPAPPLPPASRAGLTGAPGALAGQAVQPEQGRQAANEPPPRPLPATRHAPPARFSLGRPPTGSQMPPAPPAAPVPAPLAAPPRSAPGSAPGSGSGAGHAVAPSSFAPGPVFSGASSSKAAAPSAISTSALDALDAANEGIAGAAADADIEDVEADVSIAPPSRQPESARRSAPLSSPAPSEVPPHRAPSHPAPPPRPSGMLPPASLPPRRPDRSTPYETPAPPEVREVPVEARADDTIPPPAIGSEPSEHSSAPVAVSVRPHVSLHQMEALSLLTEAQREELASTVQVSTLAPNDEVTGFGLALVVRGQVNVSATVAEAPALRAGPGELVRSGGTAIDQVKIRLVPVGDDVEVASWSDENLAPVLANAPDFAAEMSNLADHIQVRVGVALGPLGERLDFALRTDIVDRLETRHLKEGEIVVAIGKPVPGMIVVGAGSLELVDGETHLSEVSPGEFLFAEAILGGGKAPHTARAGKGGATILFGGRLLAQELLVTCPPLLELFAGM